MASTSTPAGEAEGFETRVRNALGNKVSWTVLMGVNVEEKKKVMASFFFYYTCTSGWVKFMCMSEVYRSVKDCDVNGDVNSNSKSVYCVLQVIFLSAD